MPTKNKTTNGSGNGRAGSHNGHAGEESFTERLTRLESQMGFVATKDALERLRAEMKEDMAKLRAELKEDMAKLRGEMNAHVERLRADMERLRADNERLRANVEQGFNRMTRWNVASIMSAAALIVAFLKLFP